MCVRACVCVGGSESECVCVCVRARAHVCMRAFMHVCVCLIATSVPLHLPAMVADQCISVTQN